MTGRPRRSASANGAPSSVVVVMSGAGSPIGGLRATATGVHEGDDADRRDDGDDEQQEDRTTRRGGASPTGDRGGARHGRMDGADELVLAGGQGRDVVEPRLDAREDLALPDSDVPSGAD